MTNLQIYAKLLTIKKTFQEVFKMSLKKVTKKVAPVYSAEDIARMGKEYAELSAQIKVLEAKKKELSDKIKNGAEMYGVKDDKGSYYFEDDYVVMGKVAKKSFKIDQEKAVAILDAMGLSDVVDTVVTKTVNEDRLQKAVQGGKITLEDVESFTQESVSYSVLVKEKEVLPEVEQTTLKVARKK